MSKKSLIKIGKITRHHGLKGEVRFLYFGNRLEDFNYKEVYLYEKGELLSLYIEKLRFHKNFILLKFKNIDSIDEVEKRLKGKFVYIKEEQLPELDEEEYYWQDLIGCKVINQNKGFIGKVVDLIDAKSNDVLIVKKGKDEILIPFIDDVILEVDLDNKIINVSLLEAV